MTYLPSEPSARVDGLTDIEAPVRPARSFAEALSFLRSWREDLDCRQRPGGKPRTPQASELTPIFDLFPRSW